jgi:hypothetical protein
VTDPNQQTSCTTSAAKGAQTGCMVLLGSFKAQGFCQ